MAPIYTSVADIELTVSKKSLIEMTDDNETGQVDDAVVNAALERAESVVNSYLLAAGYGVPVSTPLPAGSEVIKTASTWLGV